MRFPGGDVTSSLGWVFENIKQLRKQWDEVFANGQGGAPILRAASVQKGIIISDLGGDPSTPAAGTLVFYGKTSGGVIKLFVKYSDGTVVGPIT